MPNDDNINDNWQEYSEEIPEHIEALQKLSISDENQVLAAFAEWGISMENAKEKMEAYLENLSKMGTKEVESLKEEYQNFSNDYQEEGRKE